MPKIMKLNNEDIETNSPFMQEICQFEHRWGRLIPLELFYKECSMPKREINKNIKKLIKEGKVETPKKGFFTRIRENTYIDQRMISALGNNIYTKEGVCNVLIKIGFEDGSAIGFKKCEEEDNFESLLDMDKD